MHTDTQVKILAYIKEKNCVSPHQLALFFGISKVMVHRHLKKLLEEKQIEKKGLAPKVHYCFIKDVNKPFPVVIFAKEISVLLEDNFLYFQADGKILRGEDGFKAWCIKNKLSIQKTALEYAKTLQKYQLYKDKNALIDGTHKMQQTFPEVFLDKTYSIDFYAIERFGKTKLGALLLYAKQTQNIKLMREIAGLIIDPLKKLIQREKIDTIAFIPHSIKRQNQLLPILKQLLNLGLPELSLIKIQTEVTIAQKTLSSLSERIENATQTIFVENTLSIKAKNILLIDDAIGSGATLNETARKIRQQKICTGKIIGFAIVGSLKGFEILTEI